jgi:hypothetical protein
VDGGSAHLVFVGREEHDLPARPGTRHETAHPAGKKMISASRCAAGEFTDLGESHGRDRRRAAARIEDT